MAFSLSPVINRRHFSGTQMNAYSQALLQMYAVAVAPRFPFFKARLDDGKYASGDWEGFIYHVSNAFRWRSTLAAGGRILIRVNGTQIVDTNSDGANGTTDISSLSLNLTQIYSVETDITGMGYVDWLGEVITVAYTAPPTFTDGNVLPPTTLSDLRSRILDLGTLAVMPCSPCEHVKVSDAIYGKSSDRGGSLYAAKMEFVYTGADQLNYRISHGSEHGQVNTIFTIDSTNVLTISEVTGEKTHQAIADLSAYMSGFTLGSFHELKLRTKVENTDKKIPTFCKIYWIAFESTYAPATTPNIWEHGDQDIDQTNLSWYSNLLKALMPGSGSTQAGLYYEYPAVRTNNYFDDSHLSIHNSYTIRHYDKYLHYEPLSGETPQLTFSSSKASLEEDDGDHICDVDKYNVGYGEYYQVDNVNYALEAPTGE
jgi:hypothetical protein